MIFGGIDPGLSGAVCAVCETVTFYDAMDIKSLAMWDLFEHSIGIETQTYSPRQKGAGTNMKNYGILLGKLEAYSLNFKEIHSTQWYRRYKIPSGLKTKDRKQMTADIMSELYPDYRDQLYGPRGGLLDGRSDALAIAHHMKMLHSELSS